MRFRLLFSSGAAWTGGIHQEPATQSSDITDTAADAANLGGDNHDFAAFDDFDESAASGMVSHLYLFCRCSAAFSRTSQSSH